MSIVDKGEGDNKVRVTFFLNTEKNHEGKTISFNKATYSKDAKGWDLFKQFVHRHLKAHTPVMRIYAWPSHKVVKSVKVMKEGKSYIVAGKEYLLGVKHTNHDYPIALRKGRKQYLKTKKK